MTNKNISFSDLVRINRSYRRYDNNVKPDEHELKQLIEMARLSPSSKNRQPLRYILVTQKDACDFVASQLKWAWYLSNWDGPVESEMPGSYLVMLIDKQLNDKADFDAGIAAQTILLGAAAKGLGGCIIRTFNSYELSNYYSLPENLEIVMVIAIGKPMEEVEIDEGDPTGNYAYYRDKHDKHHVPKRPLEELIYNPLQYD